MNHLPIHFDPENAPGSAFLPPGAREVVDALSRIGYQTEESFADLIDNSIDKGAGMVEIRFRRTEDKVVSIHIGDDGFGIPSDRFAEAMRLGSQRLHGDNGLGQFGLGLNTASLSQTRRFALITKRSGTHSGIRFDRDMIDERWEHPFMSPEAARLEFERAFDEGRAPPSGTVLVWEAPRLNADTGTEFEAVFQETLMRIDAHLGTVFGAHIRSGLRIRTVVCNSSHLRIPYPHTVMPNDPFDYGSPPVAGWPKTFRFDHAGRQLSFEAHIWPYGEKTRSFLLGAASGDQHQGLYIYRNGRPIMLGGWSRLIPKGGRRNLSLARIKMEVDGDVDVGVVLQKNQAVLPDALIAAMRTAVAGDSTLDDYLACAAAEFRRGRTRAMKDRSVPLAPGAGFSGHIQTAMKPPVHHRKIDFAWARLAPDRVFEIDHKRGLIELNEAYAPFMTSQSGSDPVSDIDGAFTVKLLLMKTFEDSLKKTKRLSLKMMQEIDALNRDLLIGYLKRHEGND